ncbi:hypothetical protein PVMG_05536 [Plasmodium vivax Mauritania I]|uniref:Uncharacterized protein n=1 Tax=Plasmodium vivax Mauritania I TaxID=1035515 RepID=A0A0J9TH39_PLAVI|nr:hypothetical protein PVMG_05536 [Plasmodium vivax Mauritania I]
MFFKNKKGIHIIKLVIFTNKEIYEGYHSNIKKYIIYKMLHKYNFIADSGFYKTYKEFNISCTNYQTDGNASCPNNTLANLNPGTNVTDLLNKLYSNLYRVYASNKTQNNDYFEGIRPQVEKIGCICLKYWLYDQIVSKGLEESEIKKLFEGYEEYINGKIVGAPKNYCNFSELSLNQINTLKNIYGFYAILYDNTRNSETCKNDNCKYMDYFGKGLDEFINGINNCTSNSPNKNFCNEFNEFVKMCKDINEYAGISIYDEGTKSKDGTAGKYFLFDEKYQNEQLYIYLKDKKLLNFVKTSHFVLTKNNTTIAATSVVGSAIGLSSIFYYLYKVNLKIIKKCYCNKYKIVR